MNSKYINIGDNIIVQLFQFPKPGYLHWGAVGGYAGNETHLVKIWWDTQNMINATVYNIERRKTVFQYVTHITDEQKILERIGQAIRDDSHI